MRIAILTFDGCNEIEAFVPLGLLNGLASRGWKAELACPTSHVTSMNGVTLQAQQPLEFANQADAVILVRRPVRARDRRDERDRRPAAARSAAPADRRPGLGHAAAGAARPARRCAGLHRRGHPALGGAGRRARARRTVSCPRAGGHRRRQPGCAVPGRVDDAARCRRRGRKRRAGTGGADGRARRAGRSKLLAVVAGTASDGPPRRTASAR